MKKQNKEKAEKNKKTILVVDDEPNAIRVITTILQEYGYKMISAWNGKSGYDIYKKTKPDLIITDLKMPDSDGNYLISKIREKDKITPIIILSAFGTSDSAIVALRDNEVDDYYIKPPNYVELRHSIIELLKRDNYSEKEVLRIKKLNCYLKKNNEILEEHIKQLSKGTETVPDKYRYIIAAIDHSLKGELMHIGNSIKNLRELTDGSQDIIEEYDMIERSIQYTHLFLRRLLDFLDIGKPSLEKVEISEILKRTELLIRPRLPSNIDLIISYSKRKQLIFTNVEQLMGVLIELNQNAINVLRETGGKIELHVEDRNNKITLSVKDNGPGIPEKLRRELFKKEVKSKKGLGIGLFLCSKVINELGGKLSLENTSEKGTTFAVLLPKTSDKKGP